MEPATAGRSVRAMLLVAACAACAAAPGPAYAEIPLDAVRVALPAERVQGAQSTTLLPNTRIAAGDRIRTGARGRAALQLAGMGQIVLGGDSSLLIHSADPPDAGHGAIARLALERGALRLDSRARPGLVPQDFRVNLGRLRMRVFGAEVWTELTQRGESVCLLAGAVEILSATGTERLDEPGHCLLFTGQNQRLLVKPDVAETLARKLARTAFAEDYAAHYEAERADAAPLAAAADMIAAPAPPDAAAAPPPAAPAPPTPIGAAAAVSAVAAAGLPTADASGTWTVVVASAPTEAAARAEVERLRARGLGAEFFAHRVGTATRYRVTVGRYASREAAARQARELQAGIAGAWVLRL